jgi:hypothetical protein
MHVFAGMLFVSGVLLLYTAIIAPVQIFLWEFDDTKCNVFPTLYFDLVVDVFFLVMHVHILFDFLVFDRCLFSRNIEIVFILKTVWMGRLQAEIIVQFCTGSLDISETYCDDFRYVATKYLSSFGGFWFDFTTSLPWSFNDLYAYQV